MRSKKLISLTAAVTVIMQLTQGMAYSAYADALETLDDSEGTIASTIESAAVEDEIATEESASEETIKDEQSENEDCKASDESDSEKKTSEIDITEEQPAESQESDNNSSAEIIEDADEESPEQEEIVEEMNSTSSNPNFNISILSYTDGEKQYTEDGGYIKRGNDLSFEFSISGIPDEVDIDGKAVGRMNPSDREYTISKDILNGLTYGKHKLSIIGYTGDRYNIVSGSSTI